MTSTTTHSRRGTILIIVAGISALLASLALTFLVRMRSDVEESQYLLQYAQAKIMVAAGCNYIQETSRIGWEHYWDGAGSVPSVDGLQIHEEAYGWIDVRDGSLGPRNRAGQPLFTDSSKWPALGTHVRCPMYTMKRTPYAIRMDAGFNLMQTKTPSASDYCFPLLRYPDPQPVVPNGWSVTGGPGSASATNYADFKKGDRTPYPESTGRSWFRVYRDGPGTFILTCGAGGTDGFKDWAEMTSDEKLQFPGDQVMFNTLRNAEVRLYYRLEWTAASTSTTYHNLQHEIATNTDHYETWPPNASHTWSSSRRTQTWMKNPVGTIRWIQRLVTEPTYW